MIKRTLLAAALTVSFATSANAALVVNPGFESGPDTGGSFVTLPGGDTSITGWTVTGATMAFRSNYKTLSLPIPTNIQMIHDGWIALTVAAVADVVTIDEPLIKYRQHERQQIGAPTRLPKAAKASALEALKRSNPSTELHNILETLEQRLMDHRNEFDCRKALAFAGDYARHLDARANLPQRRLNRLPTILRELLTWRYHEYANGFKSAAKDLVS